jgi:hypothetical protein
MNYGQKLLELIYEELLAKPAITVSPAKAGVQKFPKNLDSGFLRNDEKGFLQKAMKLSITVQLSSN